METVMLPWSWGEGEVKLSWGEGEVKHTAGLVQGLRSDS